MEKPEHRPRELAVTFTDAKGYFLSEASVYRFLKAHNRLLASFLTDEVSPNLVAIHGKNQEDLTFPL